MIHRQPTATLFPYTTLFRSARAPTPEGRQDHPTLPLREKNRNAATVLPRVRSFLCSPVQLMLGNLTRNPPREDRKSTRLNSSHLGISYAVFCLKKKKQ